MNIYSKHQLNVKKEEVVKEYNKMTDEELQNEVMSVVSRYRLNRKMSLRFIVLFKEVPLTRNQSILFLNKFKKPNEIIGYVYRHMLRCAVHYGVPKSLINKYTEKRKQYKMFKTGLNKEKFQNSMHEYCNLLFDATLEQIQKSKSRKFKLNTLIDKMAEKVDK